MAQVDSGGRFGSLRFVTMVALLAACFLFGGASRLDVFSLIVLQAFAVICAAIFLLSTSALRWQVVAVPLLMLAALAGIMAVQLIPLPPAVWLALPGHEAFREVAALAGVEQPWRPMSLTPDLTLGSLVSLSVPAAVLIGFAALTPEQTRRLLPVILIGIGLSAVVGLAQIAGGGRGPLYFYEVTNLGSPVGLFANRNHQAVTLALAFPMLALWASRTRGATDTRTRPLVALAVALFFVPVILAIGSRAGLVFAVIGLAAAWHWRRAFASLAPDRRSKAIAAGVGTVALAAVIGASLAFSRDEALQRLTGMSVAEEVRLSYMPTVIEIVRDFLPLGTGFGSFDPIFRVYEPFELLSPQYLNHAHNDLLELVLTGGLPALALLAWFLVWAGKAGLPLLRPQASSPEGQFARLGLVVIIILLLSSLVDYPLRTPLLAALFAVACGWLSAYSSQEREPRTDRDQESALPTAR